MKNFIWLILVILFGYTSIDYGQSKGTLVIVGGVQTPEIVKKFVELAGGNRAKILIIPNAGSNPIESSEIQKQEFAELGASADYLIFTKETADNEINLNKMQEANAVFFLGGDQSNLTRDMLGTKLLDKVFEIYNSGGVVGGSSAGAAVMSEVMITGNELNNKDSTSYFVTIEKGNIETKKGFGFLKTVVIDQHFLKRKRHNRLISVVLEHPNLIGVAIDESTAIVVYPDDTFEVLGDYQVLVYDPTESKQIHQDKRGMLGVDNMKLHVLLSGSRFDLKSKQVQR